MINQLGQPTAKAMQHDADYSRFAVITESAKIKLTVMVKSLDAVPYNERQWGHWLARNPIITKQKLGLGLK